MHVPSEVIARFDPELGAGLLGDKAHSVIFDNSKIRDFVPDFAPAIPFAAGAAEIMAWYDADPARQVVDPALDRLMDALVAHMQAVSAALTTDSSYNHLAPLNLIQGIFTLHASFDSTPRTPVLEPLNSVPPPDLTSCQAHGINFIISDIQVFNSIPFTVNLHAVPRVKKARTPCAQEAAW